MADNDNLDLIETSSRWTCTSFSHSRKTLCVGVTEEGICLSEKIVLTIRLLPSDHRHYSNFALPFGSITVTRADRPLDDGTKVYTFSSHSPRLEVTTIHVSSKSNLEHFMFRYPVTSTLTQTCFSIITESCNHKGCLSFYTSNQFWLLQEPITLLLVINQKPQTSPAVLCHFTPA